MAGERWAASADDDTLTSRATEVLYGIAGRLAGVVQLGVGGLILARNAFGLSRAFSTSALIFVAREVRAAGGAAKRAAG